MNQMTIFENNIKLPFQAGQLISIRLKNFMCHDLLEINFTEKINFITGANGSGKSAILTAIILCLGSRASFTQRGSNMESFIKNNASESEITVKISNNGLNSFKSQILGNYFTIRRTIKKGSGSFYKIHTFSGALYSRNKEDILNICSFLNVQIDNPLVVLTQESAKKFLINSTSKSLYDVNKP